MGHGVSPEPGRRMALDDVQPAAGDTRAYLAQLSKAVFRAGMSWSVVEAKWPGISAAFHGFDPKAVAGLGPRSSTQSSETRT